MRKKELSYYDFNINFLVEYFYKQWKNFRKPKENLPYVKNAIHYSYQKSLIRNFKNSTIKNERFENYENYLRKIIDSKLLSLLELKEINNEQFT